MMAPNESPNMATETTRKEYEYPHITEKTLVNSTSVRSVMALRRNMDVKAVRFFGGDMILQNMLSSGKPYVTRPNA